MNVSLILPQPSASTYTHFVSGMENARMHARRPLLQIVCDISCNFIVFSSKQITHKLNIAQARRVKKKSIDLLEGTQHRSSCDHRAYAKIL